MVVELPAEAVAADSVFRVQLVDGRVSLLHIELQGRRSRRPMPIRMLDYMARLIQQYGAPLRSVVLYLDRGAGKDDTRQHHSLGPDGEITLAWNYRVVHLWQMDAEQLLALGRYSLLPLAGLTQFSDPPGTLPKVIAAIHAVPDPLKQVELLEQFMGLLRDEEILTMTREFISDLDLEEIKRFPYMWEQYLRINKQSRIEGQIEATRNNILEAITIRFSPLAADYRRVERVILAIDDVARLDSLFKLSQRAADFAEFEQAVMDGTAA